MTDHLEPALETVLPHPDCGCNGFWQAPDGAILVCPCVHFPKDRPLPRARAINVRASQ